MCPAVHILTTAGRAACCGPLSLAACQHAVSCSTCTQNTVLTCRARPPSCLPVSHPAVCCSPGSSSPNGDAHYLQPGEQLGVSHVIVHNAKPAARKPSFLKRSQLVRKWSARCLQVCALHVLTACRVDAAAAAGGCVPHSVLLHRQPQEQCQVHGRLHQPRESVLTGSHEHAGPCAGGS